MKNGNFSVVMFFIYTLASSSWCHLFWCKSYSQGTYNSPIQMVLHPDGSPLILGTTSRLSNTRVWLLKTNSIGDTMWTKTYGEQLQSVQMEVLPDSSILIMGTSTLYPEDIRLFKVDSHGKLLWEKPFEISGGTEGVQMVVQSDGTILVLARFGWAANKLSILLIKADSLGDTLWTRKITGLGYATPKQMFIKPDNSIITIGTTGSYQTRGSNISISSFRQDGSVDWSKTCGDTLDGLSAKQALLSNDGSILILGEKLPVTANTPDISLWKVDSSGEVMWSKVFGGTLEDYPSQCLEEPNGNIFVLGNSKETASSDMNSLLFKLNSSGDTIWTKTFVQSHIISIMQLPSPIDSSILVLTMAQGWLQRISSYGDVLWSNRDNSTCWTNPNQVLLQPNGIILVSGVQTKILEGGMDLKLSSMLIDKYAFKNHRCAFKIPAPGDSLDYRYIPVKIPSGMHISKGGTVDWEPSTDSVYFDQYEIGVYDNNKNTENVRFNMFVNWPEIKTISKRPVSKNLNNSRLCFSTLVSKSGVTFIFPLSMKYLSIYDIAGRELLHFSITTTSGKCDIGTVLPNGAYIVRIKGVTEILQQRILITK